MESNIDELVKFYSECRDARQDIFISLEMTFNLKLADGLKKNESELFNFIIKIIEKENSELKGLKCEISKLYMKLK
jgi:hypothetical protein